MCVCVCVWPSQAQLSVAHSDARAQRDAAVTAAAEASSLRRDNESLLTRTAQLETAVQQRAKQPANRPSTASTDEQSARLQAQLKVRLHPVPPP